VIQRLKTTEVAEEEAVMLKPPKAKDTASSQKLRDQRRRHRGRARPPGEVLHTCAGRPIVGYISLGRESRSTGTDCPNVRALRKNAERFTPVEWRVALHRASRVPDRVDAWDRPRLLEDVARTFSSTVRTSSPTAAASRTSWRRTGTPPSSATVKALRALLTALRNVEAVFDAYRVTPN